jgi:hypothetical protein
VIFVGAHPHSTAAVHQEESLSRTANPAPLELRKLAA